MLVQEGSCWVQRQDGARENLTAKAAVTWEPGDWVEYGFNADGGKVESYWQDDLSYRERMAIFAEVFGPDAVS